MASHQCMRSTTLKAACSTFLASLQHLHSLPASSAPSMQTMSFASTGQLLSHNLFSEGTAPPIVPAALDSFGGAPSSSNCTTAPAPNLWPWAPQPSLVPLDGQTTSSFIPSLRVAAFSSSSSARGRKRKQIDTVPPARESAGNFELMLSPSEFSSKPAATRAFGGHGASKSLVPVPGTNQLGAGVRATRVDVNTPRDAKAKPAVSGQHNQDKPCNSAAGAFLRRRTVPTQKPESCRRHRRGGNARALERPTDGRRVHPPSRVVLLRRPSAAHACTTAGPPLDRTRGDGRGCRKPGPLCWLSQVVFGPAARGRCVHGYPRGSVAWAGAPRRRASAVARRAPCEAA